MEKQKVKIESEEKKSFRPDSDNLWPLPKLIAEFLGTFALVFFGCGSVALYTLNPEASPVVAIPFVFGMVVCAMIYACGHLSGAHFNPAVTIGFACGKHFKFKQVPSYILSQLTAAWCAALCLQILLPEASSYGATVPQVTLGAAILWEFLLSFFLMFVILSVATDSRAIGTMAAPAISLYIVVAALVGGPFTGASMNPARSFGPNAVEGEWSSLGLYFAVPVIGAIAAVKVQEFIAYKRPKRYRIQSIRKVHRNKEEIQRKSS